MAKRKRFSKIKIGLILLLIGIGGLVALSKKESYETIIAQEGNHVISFRSKGLVIRDEKALNLTERFGAGLIAEYVIADGEHVEMNELLLRLYKNSESANSMSRVERLRRQRDRLSELTKHASSFYGSSEVLTKSASEPLIKLVKNIEDMNLHESFESELNFTTLLNKKRLATGRETGFVKQVEALDREIKGHRSPEGIVAMCFSDESGCFFSCFDGYENLSTSMLLEEGNKDEELMRLYSDMFSKVGRSIKNNQLGIKIVTDYEWYVLLPIDDAMINNISKQNQKVTLDFGFKGGQAIPAQLIRATSGGSPRLAIFKSNYMNEGLARMRTPKVVVCAGRISGITCPVSAVRFLAGEKGVFVREGKLIRFKKLDVIYEDKDIVISSQMPGGLGFLERLDEVIISGRNLFEEKAL